MQQQRVRVLAWELQLQRWDLCVDLGSVVEVVLVAAAGAEEELDAVAADAVIAGVHGDVPAGPDLASGVVARDDLHRER
jgi:hypothetical protein